MGGRTMLGIALIALGVLGLVYKGFEYTKKVHKTDLGLFEVRYSEKGYLDVPLWAGVICVAAGAAVLFVPGEKSARA